MAERPIIGSGADVQAGPALAEPARSANGAAAWSVSSKWSASNGGMSAACGTRAPVDELHAKPAETTGCGAGAQVDLHLRPPSRRGRDLLGRQTDR